jgi:phage I-like protein
MADDLVIVPSDGDGFVPLARTKTGRLFRKHLLNLGNLRHPATGRVITVDDTFAATLKKNFDAGVCDIVQVPLANAKNEHTEDPERNIGEVVDIEVKDKKIYAVLDVREPKHAERLGKTYLGASAMMHLDYTDTKTGKKVGPTLLHACVTNRPYVTGLENYQEIVAATTDNSDEAILLTTDVVEEAKVSEETEMPDESKAETTPAKPSLEELLTALKTDHNIDVTALQAKASEGEQAASLSQTLVKALTDAGVVKLTNDEKETVSPETVVGAVAELHQNNVTLANRVNALEKADAEYAVNDLIKAGRVLPAQKNAFVELKLSNAAMFDALVPAEPIVKLNNETGVTPPKDEKHNQDIDAEIARLTAAYLEAKK